MAEFEFPGLPPEEAIRFFRRKGYAVGFNWRDVWKEEHAVAFTVAKAMRVDILEDIRAQVDRAIAGGLAFEDFRKTLAPVLQSKGWWGRKTLKDPLTGEMVDAQLGSDRRLRTIFNVNMRMAHAAGRWERIERVKKSRPYLRYVQVQRPTKRHSHEAFHDVVRPVDDPFWDTHYPPNGFNCGCTVQQLSQRDLDRRGLKVSPPPEVKRVRRVDPRTGRELNTPEGIHPGFDYNVGKARLRAFTPPPRDGSQGGGLPTSFPPNTALPDLPAPRAVPAGRVLPGNLAERDYAERFLAEFGATMDKGAVFTDRAGEDLVISADLFRDADGELKVTKAGRHPFVLLMADALKGPDEIWWVWEEREGRPGEYLLRRRYVTRFKVGGGDGQASLLTVFEFGDDGWTGITNFAPRSDRSQTSQDRYLQGQRAGTLAYRRRRQE